MPYISQRVMSGDFFYTPRTRYNSVSIEFKIVSIHRISIRFAHRLFNVVSTIGYRIIWPFTGNFVLKTLPVIL